VIDARGQITAALPLNEAGYLDTRLPPPLPPTLYARTGDWPVLLFALFWIGAVALRNRFEMRH
jgi:apolipoprotein N-acyltransferase